jgi:tetratricopeptide (TPR) repeat protein
LGLGLPCSALAQDDAARAQARAHFMRGLELYDDGERSGALSEFEEAFRISPNPRLLFNLGQVHLELGHAVEAADAFERFLREADGIEPALRSDAERELERARARIGRLAIEVAVPGARIFVDDVERGALPLDGPLPVSAGEHVVTIQAIGHEALRHRFRVAGGATYTARLELVPSGSRGASLRIESRVPGVEVRVDGVSMGITPLEATVPVGAGPHRVEGVRDGYEPFAIEVSAVEGSESRVIVQTRPDEHAAGTRAALRLRVPDPSATLEIDGDEVSVAATVEVPIGLHDVALRVADREPIAERIDVPIDGYDLAPAYRWTPDARAARLGAAESQRVLGIVGTVTGAVLAVGSAIGLAATFVWYDSDVAPRFEYVQACERLVTAPMCLEGLRRYGLSAGREDQFTRDYEDRVSIYYGLLGLTITSLALSAIATSVAVVSFASAPSERDIDRSASAGLDVSVSVSVELGPGSLGLRGRF